MHLIDEYQLGFLIQLLNALPVQRDVTRVQFVVELILNLRKVEIIPPANLAGKLLHDAGLQFSFRGRIAGDVVNIDNHDPGFRTEHEAGSA